MSEQLRGVAGELERLTLLIQGRLLHFGTEAALQADVEALLLFHQVLFEREHRFDRASRVDFWLPFWGIALECKTEGGPSAVWQQMTRYAAFEEVHGLLLVTSRNTHRINCETVMGKPMTVVWIGNCGI